MNNIALKQDLDKLKKDPHNLTISKGTLSGNSIDIVNNNTNEDMGNYLYYENYNKRDEDFEQLSTLTK